jgi:putative Mn2+ efflux pump MntP
MTDRERDRRTTQRLLRVSNIAMPLVIAFVGLSLLYTVLTGNGLGTDTHYNTFGRILSAMGCIVILVFGAWNIRSQRRLNRSIKDEDR